MNDLDCYIQERLANDPEFRRLYEEGQAAHDAVVERIRKCIEDKCEAVYHYGDKVEVRDWMGGWNVGKVVDLTADGQYKVECCGLTCWLRPSDMRKKSG